MSVIKQGNTGPLYRVGVPHFDSNGLKDGTFEDLSSVNWTCTVAVPTADSPISRAVTTLSSDNTRFLVQLTPAETLTIPLGTHTVAIEVSNPTTTPEFNVESHQKINVESELIP